MLRILRQYLPTDCTKLLHLNYQYCVSATPSVARPGNQHGMPLFTFTASNKIGQDVSTFGCDTRANLVQKCGTKRGAATNSSH